ncbi:MAG: IS200/IS605 family transposase [Chitinophagaceae bacterium]|nr:IS200/IS605 family transposase [Chitinophagaceae bacterium]
MSTYTQILYQIVFSTKRRARVLTKERREDLFKYIGAVIRNNKCVHYQIGGIEDHIHIIIDLHPTIALSSLVKDIKLSSASYIKSEKLFPNFNGWQNGYGAFTYAIGAKENLINYVKNQEEHHHKKTFEEEYRKLLETHDIKIEEQYFLSD